MKNNSMPGTVLSSLTKEQLESARKIIQEIIDENDGRLRLFHVLQIALPTLIYIVLTQLNC